MNEKFAMIVATKAIAGAVDIGGGKTPASTFDKHRGWISSQWP